MASEWRDECAKDGNVECRGEVHPYRSRSGATVSTRCEAHQDEYEQRMDALHADISSRYPGYDQPGSPPPPGFDPAYAGERWDEDY